MFNPLIANPTKWTNTLKQFVDELFECVRPFCGIGAQRNNLHLDFKRLIRKSVFELASKCCFCFLKLAYKRFQKRRSGRQIPV